MARSRTLDSRALEADVDAVLDVRDIHTEQELIDRLRELLPIEWSEDEFARVVQAIREEVPLLIQQTVLH
jgi:hypothetical protein